MGILISDKEKIEILEKELEDARNVIQIWEKLFEVFKQEKIEAQQIIHAHENLITLVREEKKESKNVIEALIEHQKISQTEIHQKATTLKNILNINRDIVAVPNGDALLSKILESIIHVLCASKGFLYLKKNGNFSPSNLINISSEEINDTDFLASQEVIRDCVESKKTQIRPFSNYRYNKNTDYILVIASPLMIQDEITGVLYLDSTFLSFSLEAIDIDTVEIFSTQLALAIESGVLYEKLEKEFLERTKELNITNQKLNHILKEIKSDMKLAKNIQSKLLPREKFQLSGLYSEIDYIPMLEIGGDIYDFFELKENIIRVFLADATGHGIQAALTTMLIKSEFEKLKYKTDDPGKILKIINNNFLINYKSLNVFFTCIICDIDLKKSVFKFSSAGHPDQVFIQNNGLQFLSKSGKLIGIKENMEYKTIKKEFLPGDKLVFFTDGMYEVFDDKDEMFGEDKLFQTIESKKDKSIIEIKEKCFSEIKQFKNYKTQFDDDITFIGLNLD